MKTQIQQGIVFSLSLLVGFSATGATVQLGSILAPVEWHAAPKPTMNEVRAVELRESTVRKAKIVEVKLDDVLARLEKMLTANLSEGSKVSLASRGRWDAVKTTEDVEWDLVLNTPFAPDARGRWYPSINLLLDGEAVSKHRLTVDVALFRKVWMVGQRMDRGVGLDSSMLEPVVRDVFSERGLTIPVSEDLSGYELDRTVGRGALLSWEDLRQQPHVRRNALVDVLAQSGSITIRMRGRCMEDGVVGEMVTVRNVDTNRDFNAHVVSTGTVKFEL